MKKGWYGILMTAAVLAAGCGAGDSAVWEDAAQGTEEETAKEAEKETEREAGEKFDWEFLFSEDESTIIVEYSEEEDYADLAEFLIDYYQVPEEYQTKTRYYYNYIDLNDDGMDELFAVVIGDYTEGDSGDPALILSIEEGGTFAVSESFEEIQTPVIISEQTVNGWHDIIYRIDGWGPESGYRICHYQAEGGYQTDANELVEEMVSVSGTQILSNNLIDDMDQGHYLTLAPRTEE